MSLNTDDLYVCILLELSDEEVLSPPHDISLETLFKRFPITAERCLQSFNSRRLSPAEIDENMQKVSQ